MPDQDFAGFRGAVETYAEEGAKGAAHRAAPRRQLSIVSLELHSIEQQFRKIRRALRRESPSIVKPRPKDRKNRRYAKEPRTEATIQQSDRR